MFLSQLITYFFLCVLVFSVTAASSISNPLLVTLDSPCFIHFITSGNQSNTSMENEEQLISTMINGFHLPFINTFTVHKGLDSLNFGIGKVELLENEDKQFSIKDRYFRLHFRLQEECTIFILLLISFEETLRSFFRSGFGTSDRAFFFIGVDNLKVHENSRSSSNILKEFASDLREYVMDPEEMQPFKSNLIFFFEKNPNEKGEMPLVLYCLACPEKIGKFHRISTPKGFTSPPTLPILMTEGNLWNNQGYGSKIIVHSPGNWEQKDMTRVDCTRRDRKLYEKINRCYYAEILVLNMLDDVLNMTYGEFRRISFFETEDVGGDWYLNINTDEWSLGKVVNNVYASTRGSYQIFQQAGYKFIYCNKKSQVTSIAWDIFLNVLGPGSWISLVLTVAAIGLVSGSVRRSIDLVWPFFGMPTWFQHSKFIMAFYLLPIAFLQSSYNSATSTDFIQLRYRRTPTQLFEMGYKIWLPGVGDSPRYVQMIYNAAPDFFRSKVKTLIGGRDVKDILFKKPDEKFRLSSDISELIKEMATRKILVVATGLPRYHKLMQIFSTTDWAIIGGKEGVQYLCGGVDIPPDIQIPERRHAFRMWGFLASSATLLVTSWFEMGFVRRFQVLLNHKLTLVRLIQWARASVTEPTPISYNSPLGVACLGLVVSHLASTSIFLVQHTFCKG